MASGGVYEIETEVPDMMEKKIDLLKRMVEESTYTVALCGSGMMEEGGFRSLKNQEREYYIEERYG